MDKNKLENFEKAFSSRCSGCIRTCECGKLFFDSENSYDWNEGELEALIKNPKATQLPYSVGTISLEGGEFVMDCTCWHERANKIMNWMDNHSHAIAEWLSLEKKRKQIEADNSPIVK